MSQPRGGTQDPVELFLYNLAALGEGRGRGQLMKDGVFRSLAFVR